jgi:hypothetical protein
VELDREAVLTRAAILFALPLSLFFRERAAAQSGAPAMDTIVFANGDRLSGKLVGATSDSVSFDGKVTKLVTLQWSDIRQLDLAGGVPIVTKSLTKNAPGNTPAQSVATIRVDGQDLVFDPGTATAKTVPIQQLVFAGAPAAATSKPQWGGQISSAESEVLATQHQYQFGGNLYLGHVTASEKAFDHQADTIQLQATFGESQKPHVSPVITRLYEGVLQHDFYLTDTGHNADGSSQYGGWRAFVLSDWYDNFSLGMKLEQAYGAGVAWDGEHGAQRFGVGADLRYIGEDLYSTAKRLNLAASSLRESYSVHFPFAGKLIIVSESGAVIPVYNASHALQARGVAAITLPLTKKFSVGPSLTDDYLSNAPHNSKQNYLNLKLSLNYTIGAAAAP